MRVPDDVLQCVCFLCVKYKDTYMYGGTAFFISVESEKYPERSHLYLVTAKHCVEQSKKYGDLYIRLNKIDGNFGMIRINMEWYFPENESSDVAVLPFPPARYKYQYKHINDGMFATEEIIKEQGIGVGDDLVIVGLFTKHYGNKRNIPIVRTGIIASMPNEPLEDKNTGLEYYAYLAEVRSIGGLSGSPVFAWLGAGRFHQKKITLSQKVYLLGLIRGHWDIKNSRPPIDFTDDELQQVNMGIAIITPIKDALEIIKSEEFVKMRRKTESAWKKNIAT